MLTSSPTTIIIDAFTGDPVLRKATITSPKSMSANCSGGPNLSAKAASPGASSIRPTMLKVPATNEAAAAIVSAGPARPLRAIW